MPRCSRCSSPADAGATLKEVVEGGKALANLYRYQPAASTDPGEVQAAVEAVLSAQPSPYDSHPSPQDRFTWVRALNAPGTGSSIGDAEEAWTLFTDREAVEKHMTTVVRQNLALNHGVNVREA
jgi:hypothetical protein